MISGKVAPCLRRDTQLAGQGSEHRHLCLQDVGHGARGRFAFDRGRIVQEEWLADDGEQTLQSGQHNQSLCEIGNIDGQGIGREEVTTQEKVRGRTGEITNPQPIGQFRTRPARRPQAFQVRGARFVRRQRLAAAVDRDHCGDRHGQRPSFARLLQSLETFFDPFRRVGVAGLQKSDEVEIGQVFGQRLQRRGQRTGFDLDNFNVQVGNNTVEQLRFRTRAIVEQNDQIGRTRLRSERSQRFPDPRKLGEKRHDHRHARFCVGDLRDHAVICRLRHGLPFVTEHAVEFHLL